MISGKSVKTVPNQFEIHGRDNDGKHFRIFQSYHTTIAKITSNKVFLDVNHWDYSTTTGKYRNIFLNENKRLTEKKITNRVYSLADLNS